MITPVHVGIIGCGNISGIYLENSKIFDAIDVVRSRISIRIGRGIARHSTESRKRAALRNCLPIPTSILS